MGWIQRAKERCYLQQADAITAATDTIVLNVKEHPSHENMLRRDISLDA